MAWDLPILAVTGVAIAASWGNATRNSLSETAAAKATTEGKIFKATGTNALVEVGGMVLIEEDHLSADGAINFQSIPADFRHLLLICRLRSDRAAASDTLNVTFNSDTGSNYDQETSVATATTPVAEQSIGASNLGVPIVADSADADLFDYVKLEIPDYADGGIDKVAFFNCALKFNTSSGGIQVRTAAGFWRNVAAITRIDLTPAVGTNWMAESNAALYGMSV